MIKTPVFNKFRTSECIQFFVDVCKIYEENNAETLNLGEQRALLVRVNEQLAAVFKQDKGSSITDELVALDQRRDEAIICLRKLADAYTDHFDEAKKEAGKKLLNAIDKYGSKIYAFNYQAETSTITNLVNDFETIAELIHAIALLVINEVVDELKLSNNLFNKRYLARVQEEASKELISAGDIVKEGINHYRELIAHTEARATLTPSEEYTTLIKQLNVLVDKYNDLVAARGDSGGE